MRLRAAVLAGVAGALAFAGPAFAHVEVSADKTTAGATDVTLTFTGEAENPKAGIKSERVVLPAGIAQSSVSLVSMPAGWSWTPAADGFTVGGKALKTGTDAVWKVKIAKLPDGQTRLSFKTLETYGDGSITRWIEIQEPGQPEPDNPAPLVTLKPGAPAVPADDSPPSSAGPTSAAPTSAAPSAAAQPAPPAKKTSGAAAWVIVAVVVVVGGLIAVGNFGRRPREDGPAKEPETPKEN